MSKIDLSKGAPFDPGYSRHVAGFSPTASYFYITLNNLKVLNQKKFQFKNMLPQLIKLYDETTAFYLGCMLWASYIKYSMPNQPIVGMLDRSAITEDEYLAEVNYMLSYVEKFNKDCKYYLGKDNKFDDFKINILNVYKKFLKLNEGLVNTENTNQLILPEALKIPSKKDLAKILTNVETVIDTGKLCELFDLYELIF